MSARDCENGLPAVGVKRVLIGTVKINRETGEVIDYGAAAGSVGNAPPAEREAFAAATGYAAQGMTGEISAPEVIEPRNERWQAVDQAMELAALLATDDPARTKLLRATASVWIGLSTPIVMFRTEGSGEVPHSDVMSDCRKEAPDVR